MVASGFDKFRLLTWKNWMIQYRHPIQTIVELAVPILCCSLLVLIRGLVEINNYPEFRYQPVNTTFIDKIYFKGDYNLMLAYSPANPILESVVRSAADRLGFIDIYGCNNASSLQTYAILNDPFAGIEFDDSLMDATELPDNLIYALRFPAELRGLSKEEAAFTGFAYNWGTNFKLSNEFTTGPRNRRANDGGMPPGYIYQGFIAVQNAIERSIIAASSSLLAEDIPEIYIQRYPYPAYQEDILLTILEFFLPFLILISFFYSSTNIIKYITVEKENQLKEAMKIMGLDSWLHWTAWFVKCIVFMIIITSSITILFKIKFESRSGLSLMTNTDWSIIWVFLFLYSIAIVTYCFMFTVFFSKANMAATIGGVSWFILFLPFSIVNNSYASTGLVTKLLTSLFCNTGMSFGFKLIIRYEVSGFGIQWNNLFTPLSADDDLALGHIFLMFIAASVIQMLITLYVEKVFPGSFGVPEKWYYLFTSKFWTGKSDFVNVDDLDQKPDESIEDDPIGKKAGIQIRGLRKVYGNKKVAVNNLNLNMFEDQITVLLGHNGAGKTTTMSMLTGMFTPTAGTAFIDGKDIRTDINSIRSSLGLCPQHNVLFNELTVKEHIIFFSKLKGVKSGKDIDKEIQKYVNLLELLPIINAQSHTLSGGMKRKLSIGIALCGGSKVVMCDEPTSGMDPAARRALWDLLIEEKKGRTILLTTHFMDEADVLGDRIAIMAEGELKAAGSSFFLKKRFGVGYRLVCVKDNGCKPQDVTDVLAKYIPGITFETDIGSELSYVLNETYAAQFKNIFVDLEDNSDTLKIASYGVSLTTLEEVFLKVGTDSQAPEDTDYKSNDNGNVANSNGGSNNNVYNSTDTLELDTTKHLTGMSLKISQIYALVLKKLIYSSRNYILLLIQLLVPVLFVFMTMAAEDFLTGGVDLPELSISFDSYLQTVTVLEEGSIGSGNFEKQVFENYQEMFSKLPTEHGLVNTKTNMEQALLEQYEISNAKTNLYYMAGLTVNQDNITAWFNNQGYHTAPLAINLVNNAILKGFSGKQKSMTLINKPLPFTLGTKIQQLGAGNNLGFNIAFNTGFAMSFVSALFVLFYIKERVSRAKLLQFVSGANKVLFWVVSFVIDYITFVIISLLYLLVLAAYQKEGWSTYVELARIFLVLICFGFAMLPMTYLASFLFSVPASGMTILSIVNIISGIFFFMAYFILNFDVLELQHIAKPLGWVFLLFPHYSLSRGMSNLNVKQTTMSSCAKLCDISPLCTKDLQCLVLPQCCETSFYSFNEDGIGLNLIALGVMGVVFFFILYAVEYSWLEELFYKIKGKKLYRGSVVPETEDDVMDSDVADEKQRIRSMKLSEIKENNLILKDMTKYYRSMMAVNKICVGVKESECFGLLGVNGAGKTSTFKMLTGDEFITNGEAWVDGISVKTNMNQVHQRIGYCPQFDALIEDLTGRETLKIFSLLRGVPRHQIEYLSKQLANDLHFTKHLDKPIKEYSGGNKRKLSTALALIGDPSVVYLDEPTTGMDVGARRQLWNMVIKTRNSGRSVILTSHSMEECEALCTRLAIMVNGEFKCIGSTQHLKNKFSKGFILTIKSGQQNQSETYQRTAQIKHFINSTFPTAVLKEEYMDILTYQIPITTMKWSHMFGLMEEAKINLNIQDYSLGQTSLEQVFLFFTKYQRISD